MLYVCSMFNVLGVTNRSNAISIGRMYCILTYHIGGSRGWGGGGLRGLQPRPFQISKIKGRNKKKKKKEVNPLKKEEERKSCLFV